MEIQVHIPIGRVLLTGDLVVPASPAGIILFAHGSGSSRRSVRNRAVAEELVHDGFATLLFDLLTREEELSERETRHLRFDIALLSDRLIGAIEWIERHDPTATLPVGLFGASTGAAAALIAAARLRNISAVVSRGGRPDLAEDELEDVTSPTLLIVGAEDRVVVELNRRALERMTAPAELYLVQGATHLFEEPGALDEVIDAASMWFQRHLIGGRARTEPHELWGH
jgi:pimeloyl-ACP methyl ester carboxylesterase